MIRKTLVLTAALFALIVASAQAHAIAVSAACGSVTVQWYNFNDGNDGNLNNGGQNSPSYSIAFTPVGSASTSTQTGFVHFGNTPPKSGIASPQHTQTFPIPSRQRHRSGVLGLDGGQTSDGDAESATETVDVTTCSYTPTITTTPVPTTAPGRHPDHRHRHPRRRLQANRSDHLAPVRAKRPKLLQPQRAVGDHHRRQRRRPLPLAAADADRGRDIPLGSHLRRGHQQQPGVRALLRHRRDGHDHAVTPGLTTSATPASAAVGTAITDAATLTGGDHPTGTITWKLYGPNDTSCSGTPQTTSAVSVNGDGPYPSPALTPSTAGTYHWVATYSGDTNNKPISNVGCGGPQRDRHHHAAHARPDHQRHPRRRRGERPDHGCGDAHRR